MSENYRFSLLTRITLKDGEDTDLWSARDALVLKALALALGEHLPVSRSCKASYPSLQGFRSRWQLRLDERGAVMLAVALILVVLRRDEVLDGEVRRPLQDLVRRALGRHCVAELRVASREKRRMDVVGAVNPLERFDCLAVAPRDEISPAEMTPEALGMIGVEAHRLLNPFDALFRLANPGQHLALLHNDEVVVWIERQRPVLVVERLVVVAVHRQVHGGENAVHVAVVLVE